MENSKEKGFLDLQRPATNRLSQFWNSYRVLYVFKWFEYEYWSEMEEERTLALTLFWCRGLKLRWQSR